MFGFTPRPISVQTLGHWEDSTSFLLVVPGYYMQSWDVKTCTPERINVHSITQQTTSQEVRCCSLRVFGALGKSHLLSGRKPLVIPPTSAVSSACEKPSWMSACEESDVRLPSESAKHANMLTPQHTWCSLPPGRAKSDLYAACPLAVREASKGVCRPSPMLTAAGALEGHLPVPGRRGLCAASLPSHTA